MLLYHFSGELFRFDPIRAYHHPVESLKPVGLWLSDESDLGWSDWCFREDFHLDRLKYISEFDVDERRLCVLDTPDKLDSFTRRWDMKLHGFPGFYLNWKVIHKLCSGILISPYHWSRRFEHNVVLRMALCERGRLGPFMYQESNWDKL